MAAVLTDESGENKQDTIQVNSPNQNAAQILQIGFIFFLRN